MSCSNFCLLISNYYNQTSMYAVSFSCIEKISIFTYVVLAFFNEDLTFSSEAIFFVYSLDSFNFCFLFLIVQFPHFLCKYLGISKNGDSSDNLTNCNKASLSYLLLNPFLRESYMVSRFFHLCLNGIFNFSSILNGNSIFFFESLFLLKISFGYYTLYF